jgi:hypothetical protein
MLQVTNHPVLPAAELKARHAAAEAGVEYEPGQKPAQRTSMMGGLAETQQTAGTGQYLHQVEDRRAIKVGVQLNFGMASNRGRTLHWSFG